MKSGTLNTQHDASGFARHRKTVAASGTKRVEVTVRCSDAPFVKAIAGALRSGGTDANLVRRSLQPVLATLRASNGAQLVAFFHASPLAEAGLRIERDRSTGRPRINRR